MPSQPRGSVILRFLHTGDLHLDSPFVGLSSVAPEIVSATLREATLTTWDAIVELALEERVDFFLVAGDAFENANRTLRGQLRFRDGLARLAGAEIPSFVVTGNHDPESGWLPSIDWPPLIHRFGASKVSGQPVMRGGEEIARVYGIGYRVRDISTNLAAKFHRDAGVPFAVGLLHANVGADASTGNYAPCTLTDLRNADMDYWALGHIHRHRIVSKALPTAVYCGNPQGRDPGETEPRGCYVVTVDDAGRIRPEFRAIDAVRWQLLDVSIEGLADEERLVDRVTKSVDAARLAAERSIVARVRLTGRGPMHRSLLRPGVADDLLRLVREQLGVVPPFAWVESVRDDTRIEVDLDERRQADDFFGSVLRRFADERAAVTAGVESDGGDAMGGIEHVIDRLYANERARRYLRNDRPSRADIARLLEQAEALVADRLAGEA